MIKWIRTSKLSIKNSLSLPEDRNPGAGNVNPFKTWAVREATLLSTRGGSSTAVPVLARKPKGRRRSVDQPLAMQLMRAEQAKPDMSHARFEMARIIVHVKIIDGSPHGRRGSRWRTRRSRI